MFHAAILQTEYLDIFVAARQRQRTEHSILSYCIPDECRRSTIVSTEVHNGDFLRPAHET